MCASIIRSPVIIRRPMRSLSCSVGIDSHRCRMAFRSMWRSPSWSADHRSVGPRGQSRVLRLHAGSRGVYRLAISRTGEEPMRRNALAGLAVLLSASAAFAQAPGVTDSEVVLGISAPLSGPAAAWGSISMAAEAWAKHVNAQGGVNGRKLRVIVKDDAYNPGQAVANVNEMKDSVFALVCLLGTAVLNANRETVAESGIPTVWPLGNPQVFASQPRDKLRTVFMAYPDYIDEAGFLVAQAAKLEGAKKIAVFYQNDDFGKGGLEGARRGAKAAS